MLTSWGRRFDLESLVEVEHQGELKRVTLKQASEMDDPEGTCTIRISGTLLGKIVEELIYGGGC